MPTDIIPAGTRTYYAQQNGNSSCGSPRAPVEVTIQICNVKLELKLFLEGVVRSGTYTFKGETRNGPYMINTLQDNVLKVIFPTFKLPETNPYGLPGTYPLINNPNGPANKVVDWIVVEIWGEVTDLNDNAPFTYTLLEERALLLQVDGGVADLNGQLPKFKVQQENVRIVVKHRNHLSVMSSNPEMLFNTEVVKYDFSTSVTQAAKFPGEPDPMQLRFVYCLFAGDLNGDYMITPIDNNIFSNFTAPALYGYYIPDVNMGGNVESGDGSFIGLNQTKRSPVFYFIKK